MAQDLKAAAVNEDGAPKKSKKLLIIILILLFLGGGGGAGWYFFLKPKPLTPAQAAAEKLKEEEAHAKPPVYVSLETFTANLTGGEEVIQTDVSILLSKEEDAELLKAHMPVLRDRVLSLLAQKDAAVLKTGEGKAALSNEIKEAANKPYGSKTKKIEILGVFFTSFVIQ
jgi:flagellar FliL protein